MTERSFRSPSPGRDSPHVRAASDAPPVPPVPREVARTPSARNRAASLEPPLRVYSPPPTKQGGRGVSLDRAPRSPTLPTTATAPRLSKVTELDREESKRSSVNFSRPMSPSRPVLTQNGQNGSSSSSPTVGESGWFTAPVVSGQEPRKELEPIAPSGTSEPAPSEVSAIEQAIQSVADKPVKKKKKKKITPAAAGSHFASGTMGLTGTALQPPAEIEPSRSVVAPGSDPSRGSMDSNCSGTSSTERPRSYNTRAGQLLARQPSMVDEAPELEDQAETANTGRKVDAAPKTPLNTSRHAAPPVPSKAAQLIQHTPQSSIDGSALAARPESPSSHSPSRSAHFGAAPINVMNGARYQPPGRSVSPMKSALKHSPSSSVRTTSPETRFAAGRSASISGSTDGDPMSQKRKSTRVSFDDSPIVVVPGLETSRYASKSLPRIGSGEDEELGNGMKPMPVLPTFGSVRGRKAQGEPEASQPVSDTVPASMSSSQGTLVGLDHSNDHGVGGILAQDLAGKHAITSTTATNEPLPPEVTSVEGTGYHSDSESTCSQDEKATGRARAEQTPATETTTTKVAEEPEPLRQTEMAAEREHSHTVPAIAILPATPAAEEVERQLSIPGAFPEWSSDTSTTSTQWSTSGALPQSAAVTPLTAQALGRDEESSDSDNDSVYSDAAEDPSELYGGFASLDAIVETPIVSKAPPGLAISTSSNHSSVEKAEPSPAWNETTAYWKSLSERRKNELEERALKAQDSSSESESESEESEEEEEEIPAAHVAPVEPPRPVTPPEVKPNKPRAQPAAIVINTRAAPAAKQAKPTAMKHTLRSSPESDVSEATGTHLRGTMRNTGTMPSTMRGPNGGLAASKWSSTSPTRQPKGALQKKNLPMGPPPTHPAVHQRASSGTVTSTTAPTLRRTGSADSASSFKRQRGASQTRADGKITMRRSMRDHSPQERPISPPSSRGPSRFSVRSLSPAGSSAPVHMRSSMRGSAGQGTPTLRSQNPPKPEKKSRLKSPSRLGFGRSSTSKSGEAPAPTPTPMMASRFAADSDDDEPRSTFVSRFADSDDEDVDLPPVRGIPKRKGEEDGDSTDLEGEESSDERPFIPLVPTLKDIEAAHAGKPLSNGNAQGSILAGGSLRNSPGALGTSKHAPQLGGMSKSRFSFLGMGKKRASSVPPQQPRPSSSGETASLRPPKLQRRNTPIKLPLVPEDSWPLPAPLKIGGDDDRPNTSDGMAGAPAVERPDIGKRRSTNDAIAMMEKEKRKVSFGLNGGEPVYSGRTGKKKKFGTLRRMFGLHD
jgi:serine/arginine repetitive matrix protein 2